jgi:hypothetical protein
LCYVSVLCFLFEFVDHGSCRGDTAHALTRWQHPAASSEALDVLHRAMHPTSYRCIAMTISSHRGNTAHALAQWQHAVASSEALDVLHRAMRPMSYRCITMAIEIVVNWPDFLSRRYRCWQQP